MKKISVALLLSSLMSASGAQVVVQQVSGLDIQAELQLFPSELFYSGGPEMPIPMPYSALAIQHTGIDWDCSLGQCQLSGNASVDVLLRPEGGETRTVQYEANIGPFALFVDAKYPTQTVQDPLGGEWYLVPDMADGRIGVLIADNIRPADAQFTVAYGSLSLSTVGLPLPPPTQISNQTGWVDFEASHVPGAGMPSEFQDARAALFFQTPSLAAPVYALPSLDGNCMSTDCMRYERGTLMVDAYRLSFGLQAVAAVPESETWAMMALGLIGLGMVTQRRRSGRLGIKA